MRNAVNCILANREIGCVDVSALTLDQCSCGRDRSDSNPAIHSKNYAMSDCSDYTGIDRALVAMSKFGLKLNGGESDVRDFD